MLYGAIATHWEASSLVTGIPIFVGSIPQDREPPAGTFFLISGPPIVTHSGRNTSRNEIWQLAGNHWNLYDAASIRETILKLMDTFPGSYTGVTVQSCFPARSPRDIMDIRGFWLAIQEFQIFYTVEES